jgi:hypothetical protein
MSERNPDLPVSEPVPTCPDCGHPLPIGTWPWCPHQPVTPGEPRPIVVRWP